MTLSGAAAVSDLVDQFSRVPLYRGGVGVRLGSSQEQTGVVMHSKTIVVIHTKTSQRVLCCALIGDKGGKVCFHTAGTCDVQSHSIVCRSAKFEASIYFRTSSENITPLLSGRQRGIV